MLKVQNICFEYSDRPLLENVSFSLNPGKMLYLQGANGCGKTTLLRILAGLIRPISGTISLNSLTQERSAAEYFEQLVMVGHSCGLSSLLSVREHYKTSENIDISVLEDRIRAANIEPFADQWIGLLSAGQKRRGALLRLELKKKILWILDEPFIALDKNTVQYLTVLIRKHLDNNGMLVLTSHQALPESLYPCQEYCL